MGKVRSRTATVVPGPKGAVPSSGGAVGVHDGVLRLQRDAGNGAVAGLLRPGAKGARVVELQQLLNGGGVVAPVAVDGDYGRRTKTAVRQLQQLRHLAADGVAGPDTWKAARAAVDEAGSAARAAESAKRAAAAWQVAVAAHGAGEWVAAIQAYAEVVDQATAAGRDDLRTAAVARMREARLHRPPTPFVDLLTTAMAAGTEEEQQQAEAPDVQAKRAKADALFRDGQTAAALPLYQAVYAASDAQGFSDLWSIASCLHKLGRFEESVSWYRQVAAAEGGAKDETFAIIATERLREAAAGKPPTPSKELIAGYLDGLQQNDGLPKADPKRAELQALGADADARYDAGDYAGSLATYRAVLAGAARFDLGLTLVRYNAAMCLLHLGRWSEAAEAFAEARDSNLASNWYVSKLGSTELARDADEVRTKSSDRIGQALRHQRP